MAQTENSAIYSWEFKEEQGFKIMVPHYLGELKNKSSIYLDEDSNLYTYDKDSREIKVFSI